MVAVVHVPSGSAARKFGSHAGEAGGTFGVCVVAVAIDGPSPAREEEEDDDDDALVLL